MTTMDRIYPLYLSIVIDQNVNARALITLADAELVATSPCHIFWDPYEIRKIQGFLDLNIDLHFLMFVPTG